MGSLKWDLLEQVFTAETVMTPRPELLAGEQGADLSHPWAQATQHGFDLLPLADNGRIVAVLRAGAAEPEMLDDRWLVSRDTGIPDLLDAFVKSARPGLFVFHRQDVIGLVTPADLNKLPARVYLYNLIGELEVAFAMLIRSYFASSSDLLLQALGERRRQEVHAQVETLREGNADVDAVQLLYLSDLLTIVEKQEALRTQLGFPSRHAAEEALGGLNDLRTRTMHLVRPLLEEIPQDLARLREDVAQARAILQRLETES